MTTEQRIASCFQRIQELETRRAEIIEQKQQQTALLLDPQTDSTTRTLAANTLQLADELLILADNQKRQVRRLAATFQRALDAFPE